MSAIYAFLKNNGDLVRFGPHESDQAAMEAFQFRYGYWPTEVVSVTPYTRDTTPGHRYCQQHPEDACDECPTTPASPKDASDG